MVTDRNKCYSENRGVDCVNQRYSTNQKSVCFQRLCCGWNGESSERL